MHAQKYLVVVSSIFLHHCLRFNPKSWTISSAKFANGSTQLGGTQRWHKLSSIRVALNKDILHYVQVVLATGPGNPPAVRVLTGGAVRFGPRPGQKPEPRLSSRVVTRPGYGTAGISPGSNRTAVTNLRFLQLSLQLSIWVPIILWHDQYVNCAEWWALSPPASRFAIRVIFDEWLWKMGQF